MIKFALFFITVLFLSSCSDKENTKTFSAAEIDSLKQTFAQFLVEKNQSFKNAEWSPLTAEDKIEFKGLNFYAYNPDWRFEGSISIYKNPDSTQIMGSKPDDIRPALKYGYFPFEKDQKEYRLEIIKVLPRKAGGQGHLFLGFWDETSGNETYGGGRYIDLHEIKKNYYVIDFNYAYNPYCAYSDRYSCAVPPWDNRLEIAITAGEKNFKAH